MGTDFKSKGNIWKLYVEKKKQSQFNNANEGLCKHQRYRNPQNKS